MLNLILLMYKDVYVYVIAGAGQVCIIDLILQKRLVLLISLYHIKSP